MDYLEGLLLGKLWSDTDFENRKHAGLFVLYGLSVDVVILAVYLLGMNNLLFSNLTTAFYVLLAIMFLASPFICFRYYRFPIWGKLLVLLEKILKYLLLANITVNLLFSRITVSADGLQDSLINYLNGTLEKYTERFAASTGSFATIVGVMAGGVHVVFVFVIAVAVAVVVPGLIFLLFRAVQYMYDWVINRLVIRKIVKHRK